MSITLTGQYNSAVVYTNEIEDTAKDQLLTLLNSPASEGSYIAVMPNVHVDRGNLVGLTMTITDRIIPSLCGTDPSCGVRVLRLAEDKISFSKLDSTIKELALGNDLRPSPHRLSQTLETTLRAHLRCTSYIDLRKALLSLGTLGGSSHFIEVDQSEEDGRLYLLIHSGSRYLGKQVTDYYVCCAELQSLADTNSKVRKQITKLKEEGRHQDILNILAEYQQCSTGSMNLSYLTRSLMEDYLFDSSLVTMFAVHNRRIISEVILEALGLYADDVFDSAHDYAGIAPASLSGMKVLRKGAISAEWMEKFIIPLNMKDGSLICRGKGNKSWNCSAPSGVGRYLSRNEAKTLFMADKFQADICKAGVYSTTADYSTIDDSPAVYKDSAEIESKIAETASIIYHLKPLYNFKGGSE